MQKIVIDSAMEAKLAAYSQQIYLCTADGEVLGVFEPLPQPMPVADLQLESPLTVEETEELRKNRTGRPLDDILRKFGL